MRSQLKCFGIFNKIRLINPPLWCELTVTKWKTDVKASLPVEYKQMDIFKHASLNPILDFPWNRWFSFLPGHCRDDIINHAISLVWRKAPQCDDNRWSFSWYPELSEHLRMPLIRRPKHYLRCKLIEIWKRWFITSSTHSVHMTQLQAEHSSCESFSWVNQLGGRSQTAQVNPTLAANVWDCELKPASAIHWSGRC